MTSGLLPAAFLAIVLPKEFAAKATAEVSGRLQGRESWGRGPEDVPLKTPRH